MDTSGKHGTQCECWRWVISMQAKVAPQYRAGEKNVVEAYKLCARSSPAVDRVNFEVQPLAMALDQVSRLGLNPAKIAFQSYSARYRCSIKQIRVHFY